MWLYFFSVQQTSDFLLRYFREKCFETRSHQEVSRLWSFSCLTPKPGHHKHLPPCRNCKYHHRSRESLPFDKYVFSNKQVKVLNCEVLGRPRRLPVCEKYIIYIEGENREPNAFKWVGKGSPMRKTKCWRNRQTRPVSTHASTYRAASFCWTYPLPRFCQRMSGGLLCLNFQNQ